MAEFDRAILERECAVLCTYLIEQQPTTYVVNKYLEGVEAKKLAGPHLDRFEKALTKISLRAPRFIKTLDTYSRLFNSNSLFRKRLILLLAILESSSPTHVYLDSLGVQSNGVFYLRFAKQGVVFFFNLIFTLIFLLPVHFLFKIFDKGK